MSLRVVVEGNKLREQNRPSGKGGGAPAKANVTGGKLLDCAPIQGEQSMYKRGSFLQNRDRYRASLDLNAVIPAVTFKFTLFRYISKLASARSCKFQPP